MRRLIALLFFLAVAHGEETLYIHYMSTPFEWASVLFDPIPGAKIRPFDLVMLAVWAYASSKEISRGPRVRPMVTALKVSATTTFLWFVLGLARGGDVRCASWQTYLMVATFLTAIAVAATCRTAEHYAPFAKALVAGGIYRATMGVLFYVFWVRPHRLDTPEFLTSHYDTVVWTTCIIVLVANVLENRTRKAKVQMALIVPYLLFAIQINARRLAWVSLVGGIVTTFFLLRPSKIKRRITRALMTAAPVLALYVAIGWGRPGRIFAPLDALATVSTAEDASTKARNVENLGLMATANQAGWVLGTGWGHKYVEVSHKYYIGNFFELWQYVPHNSIFGLLAYTGYLGFCGYWLMFPTAVFLHARTARLAKRPAERVVGIVGVAQILICANQMYGDMGIFSRTTMYVLAASFGAAMRMPIEAGVWKGRGPAPAIRRAGPAAPAA